MTSFMVFREEEDEEEEEEDEVTATPPTSPDESERVSFSLISFPSSGPSIAPHRSTTILD